MVEGEGSGGPISFPSELLCPIMREPLERPLLCEDGFSYEGGALLMWLAKNQSSPMTNMKLNIKANRQNHFLCSYIAAFKHLLNKLTSAQARLRVLKLGLPGPAPIPEDLDVPLPILRSREELLEKYYESTIELADCCEEMKRSYEATPRDFQSALEYANILRFAGHFAEALEVLKQMKRLRPASRIPGYMKVRVLAEMNNRDKAIAHIEKMTIQHRIEDHQLIELRYKSFALSSAGIRFTPEALIAVYLSVVPNDRRAVAHMITFYVASENWEAVINSAESYLKRWPNDISALAHQAVAYRRLNKKEAALAIYQYMIGLSKDKIVIAKALRDCAFLRDKESEFELAVQDLTKSHAVNPNQQAAKTLAVMYAKRSEYAKAEEWLKLAEAHADLSQCPTSLSARAQIHAGKQEYDAAIQIYLKLSDIDPINAGSYEREVQLLLEKQDTKGTAGTEQIID